MTCRPSTLKMRNTWTAPNATQRNESERSTTGITRVLGHVSCLSCSLSSCIALFTTPIVYFPFPFCFMEFLPAWSPLRRLCDPEKPKLGCLREEFAKYVNLEIMLFKMPYKKQFPVFCSFKLCRRQAKQTLESMPRRIQNFRNYRLKIMPILEIITLCSRCRCQDTTEASRLPPQNTIFSQLLAYLAQPPSAFTSSLRTDKAGRGELEPPPEDGARTKWFDREIPVPIIPYWGRDEKHSWPYPCPLKKRIIYICTINSVLELWIVVQQTVDICALLWGRYNNLTEGLLL